ncbi:hypothetical protein [Alteribacillus sp. HJP-4]|uniref:hypothetical protein n=1 Tax=Alteribacillus sp. HJP-4 TaxID=2775394 RepID=UPI0035CD1749
MKERCFMICPYCKAKNTGKIGNDHHYCWECCVEWTVTDGEYSLFEVEEDGTLCSLDDLFGKNWFMEREG